MVRGMGKYLVNLPAVNRPTAGDCPALDLACRVLFSAAC